MPELEIRLSVSDFTLEGMNQLRGDIPLPDFLGTWLEMAFGHAMEEFIRAHRDKTYQRMAIHTNGYQQAISATKITVTPANNVAQFPGNDVTRRSGA